MSPFLVALSLWLHAVATVIFIGYYVLLALIYLPALQGGPQDSRGATITLISKHSRTWLYVSLVIFAISGAYLTLVDPDYLGLGNFSNPWTILMLVKHTIILNWEEVTDITPDVRLTFYNSGHILGSSMAEVRNYSHHK